MLRCLSKFASLFLTISALLLPQAGNAFVEMIATGIYGGSLTPESDPMAHSVVALAFPKNSCSGVIISQNKILTARHCITTPSHLIKVRFGTGNSGSNFKWANVTNVSVMENENWGFQCHSAQGDSRCTQTDVAIVTIDGVIPKGYRPLRVYGTPTPGHTQFYTYGYGGTTSSLDDGPRGRLKGLPSLTSPAFNSKVQSYSADKGKGLAYGVRPGDSGGPWVANFSGQYTIIGLNSRISGQRGQLSGEAKGVQFTEVFSPDLSAPPDQGFYPRAGGNFLLNDELLVRPESKTHPTLRTS